MARTPIAALASLLLAACGDGGGGPATPADAGAGADRQRPADASGGLMMDGPSAGSPDGPVVVAPDVGRSADAPADGPGQSPPDVGADRPAAGDLPPAGGCQPCASWGPAERTGVIAAAGLNALSGMAASWRNPGVIYVHNDRNVPRVHAVSEAGALVGRFDLGGATVSDIEDLAVSRCRAGADETCLFLADLGNNVTPRTVFAIYRAAEPAVDPGGALDEATLPAERLAFSYEDGPHNAESLLVDSRTGAVFVITKETPGVKSTVYRLETLDTTRTNRAVRVAQLPVPASDDQPATAAAAHPCGLGFLLRTGNRLYQFLAPAGAAFVESFSAVPTIVPVGVEVQGEAVSFRADGRAYYTTSEGASPPLHRTTCQ